MNLNKFFQKYATVLLIVFMSLLLVAFLLPPEMFNPRMGGQDSEIGQAFGQPVTSRDLRRSEAILGLAQSIGMEQQQIDALDAHLLMLEAKVAGVNVGPEFVRQRLSQMQGIDQILPIVRDRYNMSYEQIYAHLGEWASVYALMGRQIGAAGQSRPRQVLAFRDRTQQADVRCAVILAKDLVRHIAEPTEQQVQELFEAGKDRDTEHTDTELVYGYRQPARLKLEMLTVEPRRIQDLVRIRDLEAEAYFEDHREQFMSQPDPMAEGPALPPRQLTYEEAERQVKDALRPTKAIEQAQALVNQLHSEARNPWVGAELREDGFRVAPAADEQVSFAALKTELENKQDYPITYTEVDFSSLTELTGLTGFGQARIQAGNVMLSAPEYAMRVEGLYTPEEGDGGLVLALNEPSEVVIQTRFNRDTGRSEPAQAFLFRVTAVKPAGPPESIDEVRETVVSNWKFIQAYALAEQLASELHATAQSVLLADAARGAEQLREKLTYPPLNVGNPDQSEIVNPATNVALGMLGPTTPASFTRTFQNIRGVPSGSPELAEMVFAIDNPAEAPLAERTLIAGNTTHQAWIVAQVEGIDSLYEGQFDQQRNQFGQFDQRVVFQLWWDSDAIQARTGWKPNIAEEDES